MIQQTHNSKLNGTLEAKAAAVEALLIPDTVTAALAGVSRAHWHTLRAAGKIPAPLNLGRRVLWRRTEIEGWTAAGCPTKARWEAMRGEA